MGDEVVALPSGLSSKVTTIAIGDWARTYGTAPTTNFLGTGCVGSAANVAGAVYDVKRCEQQMRAVLDGGGPLSHATLRSKLGLGAWEGPSHTPAAS